jgi:acyl-CoA thioester hydrolase
MLKSVETWRAVAYPWNCDSMGHMNTQFYAAAYDGASFHFLSMLAPYSQLAKRQMGFADIRQLIEYKHEVRAGSLLVIRTMLTRLGKSSVEFVHEMRNVETDDLHSTCAMTSVLFDTAARKSAPLEDWIRERAKALTDG